jgi:uncharacterized protein YqgC (DUF456 family)
MVETLLGVLEMAAAYAAWVGIALLCLMGLALSAVGISGTWLVVAASAWATLLGDGTFPTWGVVIAMAALSGAVEIAEWTATHWGVRRRGGSRLAGFAAMAGGLIGALLGFLIPIPLFGNLIGMLVGSFGLAFLVERNRLRHDARAARIATGAVLAALAVMLVKISVTLGMALWLWLGLWLAR